jgi:hypothetical protein
MPPRFSFLAEGDSSLSRRDRLDMTDMASSSSKRDRRLDLRELS